MMFRPLQLLFVSNLRYNGRNSSKLGFLNHHHRRHFTAETTTTSSSLRASSDYDNIMIFASEVPVIANLNRYRNVEDVSTYKQISYNICLCLRYVRFTASPPILILSITYPMHHIISSVHVLGILHCMEKNKS